jgi:hypothetical protein
MTAWWRNLQALRKAHPAKMAQAASDANMNGQIKG